MIKLIAAQKKSTASRHAFRSASKKRFLQLLLNKIMLSLKLTPDKTKTAANIKLDMINNSTKRN